MTVPSIEVTATAPSEGVEVDVRRRSPIATALAIFVAPLLIFLAVALAATPWLRAYQVDGREVYLVAAALAPVIITIVLAEHLDLPPAVSYVTSLLGLVALVLVLGAATWPPRGTV